MSIGSEITDPDHQSDSSDDNRGNRFEPTDEAVADSAHGTDIKDHPYQLLTPDVVIDAIESTGRSPDARILALNSYENRVYQVGIEDGEPVIVKFYRPDRWSDDAIYEEHTFSQHLADLDIPRISRIPRSVWSTSIRRMLKSFSDAILIARLIDTNDFDEGSLL